MPTVFLDDGWYLDLSYFLVRLWDSNISIFKLCSFTVHFLAFLKKKKNCTKYTKCYYFHTAYVMKTVSIYHFQLPLKPCGRLKISLKIGKSIWLELNCGYCNYHKFLLLKITLGGLKTVKHFTLWHFELKHNDELSRLIALLGSLLNGSDSLHLIFSSCLMSWAIFVWLCTGLLPGVSVHQC
jgi:hypothetical protein